MGGLMARRQRRMLRGWIKWIPVVLIPFSVLFTHAWLNVEILRADYVLRTLDKESRELQEQLRHAGNEQSDQEVLEILAVQALEMDFIDAKPGQQETIYYDPAAFTAHPDEQVFEMAHRDGPHPEPTVIAPTGMPSDASSTASLAEASLTAEVPAPMEDIAIGGPAVAVTPEPATETADTADTVVPTAATEDTPVWLTVDEAAETVFAVPTPAPEKPAVVLELPEDAYVEELPGVEADMGTLEVL